MFLPRKLFWSSKGVLLLLETSAEKFFAKEKCIAMHCQVLL